MNSPGNDEEMLHMFIQQSSRKTKITGHTLRMVIQSYMYRSTDCPVKLQKVNEINISE